MQSKKIHLEPVSNPDLDGIEISGTLFPIGRAEPFFASLPSNISGQLSRRHARIFEEQGHVYVTDLHSRNGTRVNGKSISAGRPEVLCNGDIIELGGELSFKVYLETATKGEHSEYDENPAQLVLQPANAGTDLEVIVVNQFPFLIARKDSVFERYSTEMADELAQLSRRHAVVTLQDDGLFIEDMGSSNGTELNGNKLDEHAIKISNGDTLAFGGSHFVYTVCLPTADQTESKNTSSTTAADHTYTEDSGRIDQDSESNPVGEHTMFVDSPTSFLDIFCAEEDNDAALNSDDPIDNLSSQKASNVAPGPQGKWHQARQHAVEVGQAFRGEPGAGSKKPKIAVISLAIFTLIIAAYLLFDSEKSKIKTLSAQGNYSEAAQIANRYLAQHPNDSEVETGGTKALIQLLMPDWLGYITAENYNQASALLNKLESEFSNIVQAKEYLDQLEWVADLEKFANESGGIDGSIDIFIDEITMKQLLDEWNRSPNRHQQILEQVSAYYPEFKPLQKLALSHLRQLRHGFSLYNKAINELTITATNAIESGDMQHLIVEIGDYERNYPRLAGLDALSMDAQNYAANLRLLQEADLGALIGLQRTIKFETSLFQTHAQPLIAGRLPNQRIVSQFETALAAWRNGDAAQAIDALAPLKNDADWSMQVTRQIEHMQQVDTAFIDLSQSENRTGHQDKLLDFRKSLKPSEDSFYIEATRLDFDKHRDLLLAELGVKTEDVMTQWSSYLDAGGINSVMRIDENISSQYKQQAGRLKSSHTDITSVIENYALLQLDPPTAMTAVYKKILDESRRQRNWIMDLGVVMDQRLLKAKLELLPYPIEESL